MHKICKNIKLKREKYKENKNNKKYKKLTNTNK